MSIISAIQDYTNTQKHGVACVNINKQVDTRLGSSSNIEKDHNLT